MGSVSENVVRHATTPVLLVKLRVVTEMGKKVCEFACNKMPRKVLVPTDFSECANEALEVVRGLRGAGVEALVLRAHRRDLMIESQLNAESTLQFDLPIAAHDGHRT